MIKQVTVSSTAIRLLQPGPGMKKFALQNNGAVNVRLSFDGNTDMISVAGKAAGTAPTSTTGYRLAAGKEWVETAAQFPSIGIRSIWAISEGADVTIDVVTDDKDST